MLWWLPHLILPSEPHRRTQCSCADDGRFFSRQNLSEQYFVNSRQPPGLSFTVCSGGSLPLELIVGYGSCWRLTFSLLFEFGIGPRAFQIGCALREGLKTKMLFADQSEVEIVICYFLPL